MKKKFLKRLLIISVSIITTLVAAALIVPLIISPSPIEGLAEHSELKRTESRFITLPFEGTDGIETHYIDTGSSESGEPVFILLHGSMYNLFSWNEVIDDFAARGRTIAYDQAPYGLTEKLLEGDWNDKNPFTQQAAVDQLVTLIEVMGLEQVYLVGSSYGGTLAIRTALEHTEKIAGLILVDAAVFINESVPRWLVNSPQLDRIGPLFARSMGSGTTFYENCYSDPETFSGKRKEDTMIMTEVSDWDFALWQYLKAWSEVSFDYEGRIPEIDIPVLIISGEDDSVVPLKDAQKLQELIPGSILQILPDTGHLPHEESPEQFLDTVLPWIDRTIISE